MFLETSALIGHSSTLNQRLSDLHDRLLATMPSVDRIACALYDAAEDKLKTFINSTRAGQAIDGYEYKLSDSVSLSTLAKSGEFRVLDDIAGAISSSTAHANWLRKQGYQSSFTVPIYDQGSLLGFIFFDSMQRGAFTPEVQRDLVLYCSLISMAISNDVAAIRTVVESVRVTRQLTEMRDFETGKHLERMARYSRVIARFLAPKLGLSDEFVEHVYLFAPLHDIGKIGVPDRILLKQGKFNAEERKVMQTHVERGMEIIERIIGSGGVNRLPDSSILKNIVQCHHEFLDGSGYPNGLKGDQIPIEARIVTVADIYDALTSVRPYKQVWSSSAALAELRHLCAARKIDALCLQAVETEFAEIQRIQSSYIDPYADAPVSPKPT